MSHTPEQISKLPKWAQEYVKRLSAKGERASAELEAIRENQESPFYYTPLSGKPVYFTTEGSITVKHGGVVLDIDARKSDGRIFLSWRSLGRMEEVALIPATHQQAYLVSKENMQ